MLLWQRLDPQQEAPGPGVRVRLPPWGLAYIQVSIPSRGEDKQTEQKTDVLALWAGIKCQMEETFSARLDLTTSLSPPLQLRAEIVAASAQGSTAGHPPPNNSATAGRRWMFPYPKHSEAALGHLTPEKEIRSSDKFQLSPPGAKGRRYLESASRVNSQRTTKYWVSIQYKIVKPRKPGIHERRCPETENGSILHQ